MAEKNTVSVLIGGQEYTLSGDMSREYIVKLAAKVDETMKSVSPNGALPLSKAAILSAMLLCDEYYKQAEEIEKLRSDVKLCDQRATEAMHSYDDIKRESDAKLADSERIIADLKEKINELSAAPASPDEIAEEYEKHIKEIENRCRDIESSFFDLQMENIRLKNDLERYKQE